MDQEIAPESNSDWKALAERAMALVEEMAKRLTAQDTEIAYMRLALALGTPAKRGRGRPKKYISPFPADPERRPAGRPPKNTEDFDRKLLEYVENLMVENGFSKYKQACEKFVVSRRPIGCRLSEIKEMQVMVSRARGKLRKLSEK
ncbi:MAG: hypothetical protein HY985_17830 [Magnetospirillum sp.]|nr:hypothetical protein [Magnetospirillum sp.]